MDRKLLYDFGIEAGAIEIRADNQGTIRLANICIAAKNIDAAYR